MVRKETNLEITPERPSSGSPLRFPDRTAEVQAIFDDCPFNTYRMKQGNTSKKEQSQGGERSKPQYISANRIISFLSFRIAFSLRISKINNQCPIVNPNLNPLNTRCLTRLRGLKKRTWRQAVVKGLRFLDAGLPWPASGLGSGESLTEGQKTTAKCHE